MDGLGSYERKQSSEVHREAGWLGKDFKTKKKIQITNLYAMEENKKQEEPKKLTYEELAAKFNDLYVQYQKVTKMYQQVVSMDRNFEYMSFFLDRLFKVMDHPNRYSEKFVNWCSKNIQDLLIGLDQSISAPAEEPAKEEKKEEKVNES